MKQMTYAGDRTAPYDHSSRTGLLGKVFGPNLNGQWFIVTAASYDAETDVTHAVAHQIASPETALRRLQENDQ